MTSRSAFRHERYEPSRSGHPRVYAAPWGHRVRLITFGLLAAAVVAAVVLPWAIDLDRDPVGALVAPCVLGAMIVFTSLWSIRGYVVTDHELRVERLLWRNVIKLADIGSVEADSRACEGAWKTLGNDGLFAMHGRFRSKRLGKFQAYVTDPRRAVVLRLPDDSIVISPDEPARFVADVNRRLHREEGLR